MNILLVKRILLATFILGCTVSFAQKKIEIKHYLNNDELPIEDIRIFIVTKTDTITPKIEEGKIEIPRKFKENFSLFAKIQGRTIRIGSYRPEVFNGIDGIVIGRITDFSIMKRYWEFKDAFYIDNDYIITIPNSENIADVVYSTVKNDVNVSLISNFIKYTPSFDFVHEVIATK